MTVDYGSGEKHIVIPDDVPIVSFELADRNIITAGRPRHRQRHARRGWDGDGRWPSMSARTDIVPPM